MFAKCIINKKNKDMKKIYVIPQIKTIELPPFCLGVVSGEPADNSTVGIKKYNISEIDYWEEEEE